jgi:hypothetical protein
MARAYLLALGVAILNCQGCGKPPPRPTASNIPDDMKGATPWTAPGLRQPPVKSAAEAALADDVPVVGVIAGGKARAYSVLALAVVNHQIVNDLLGDVPVTVVYFHRPECLRVYTTASRGEALAVNQAGRTNTGLLLFHKGKMYVQTNGRLATGEGPDLPLDQMKFERTTWKAWREKHPQTEVYTGPEMLPQTPLDEP